ncbi:hypothetical protein CEXT_809751 [Caerostris extrusa]|uniref:Uncharacterized protein n=1 Tax=Caerostris extrusa TaxID=172846 RepID=A0AAV4V3N1_CAEEX|nr:hypothetical protein CEXT_809751 [Caerostris extrusa]
MELFSTYPDVQLVFQKIQKRRNPKTCPRGLKKLSFSPGMSRLHCCLHQDSLTSRAITVMDTQAAISNSMLQ